MTARLAGLAVGLVFGVVLAWSGLSSPDVIREGSFTTADFCPGSERW